MNKRGYCVTTMIGHVAPTRSMTSTNPVTSHWRVCVCVSQAGSQPVAKMRGHQQQV